VKILIYEIFFSRRVLCDFSVVAKIMSSVNIVLTIQMFYSILKCDLYMRKSVLFSMQNVEEVKVRYV
jgi:hypothetical protein